MGSAGIAAGAAGVGIPVAGITRRAAAQSPAGEPIATSLRGDVMQISGLGGNVVVAATSDALVLVDSGSAEHANALKSFLTSRFASAPVRTLLNTHWHLDHTGGNDAMGGRGAKIVAHENTRLWMSIEFRVDWQGRTYQPRAKVALPSETFFSSDRQPRELELGGQRILYGHLREAHTDGDVYVHFPAANVIAAGGAVTVGAYPVMDYYTGGWIGGLIESTRKLIELADPDTLIVPNVGPAQSRKHLEAQLEMLETVRERVEAMALEGKGIDDIIAARVTAEFDPYWGEDSELFISNTYEGLWWGNRLRGIVA